MPHSLFSFLSPSLSSIPLVPSSIPLLFSFSTAFSSVSSSFSLLCPHLFLLFSSFLPSLHYVFLLCLPSLSSFSEINHFLFYPPLFLPLKSTTFSSSASFSSFQINRFLFQRIFFFLSNQPLSLPAHLFLLFEGIACTVFIEGIACSVCIEGIACSVCIEGIACTVCIEGIACTVCLL